MKLSLLQENFTKALNNISKAISSRPVLAVLNNVLLETDKGRLKMSSTNLEIGISTWVGAEIVIEGKITVSAKLLQEFVNAIGPGKIDIELNGYNLVVKSVDNKGIFPIIPADEFPKIMQIEGEPIIVIKRKVFSNAIKKVSFAASKVESRPVLTCTNLSVYNNFVEFVAIDSYRISRKKVLTQVNLPIQDKKSEKAELSLNVPNQSIEEVERLFSSTTQENDDLLIYWLKDKNQLLFKADNLEVTTRLIDGNFPNYRDAIPTEKNLEITLNKSELISKLKSVSIFVKALVYPRAKVSVDTLLREVNIFASIDDSAQGEAIIRLPAAEGVSMSFGINIAFFLDFLNVAESADIIFQAKSEMAAITLVDKKDDDFLHIIMPIKLD